MESNFTHQPVCSEKVFEMLSPALQDVPHAILIDATVGLGGHSEYFLTRLPDLHIIAIDRDSNALAIAHNRLERFAPRVFFYHSTFADIDQAYTASPWATPAALDDKSPAKVLGILADFGVSSLQIDDPHRGFSYSCDELLDMRMDQGQNLTAASLLATASKAELAQILRNFGEERFAHSIASQIIKYRSETPIERTGQLVEIIYRSIPAAARRKGGHPAKRTFQALRIAVNNELELIETVLHRGFALLSKGGRYVCLSFHSLEDKLVKKYFTSLTSSETLPGFPIEFENNVLPGKHIFRAAYQASEAEIAENQRASSVRVRGIEKIV